MDRALTKLLSEMAQAITTLTANQQAITTASATGAGATPSTTQKSETTASLYDKILGRVDKFDYDSEDNNTFSRWYERFKGDIEDPGLTEEQKIRLVLSRLSAKNYNQYTEGLLPQLFSDFTFAATITNLSNRFGDTKSIFVRRYETFKITCGNNQDIITHADTVNSMFERSELSKATPEENKCLIYLASLPDTRTDVKQKALKLLEEWRTAKTTITFKTLVEECRSYVRLQEYTAAFSTFAKPQQQVDLNPIFSKPQNLNKNTKGKGAGANISNSRYSANSSTQPPCSQHNGAGAHQTVGAGAHPTNKAPQPTPCYRCGGPHF